MYKSEAEMPRHSHLNDSSPSSLYKGSLFAVYTLCIFPAHNSQLLTWNLASTNGIKLLSVNLTSTIKYNLNQHFPLMLCSKKPQQTKNQHHKPKKKTPTIKNSKTQQSLAWSLRPKVKFLVQEPWVCFYP